jgi:hypothetical protein
MCSCEPVTVAQSLGTRDFSRCFLRGYGMQIYRFVPSPSSQEIKTGRHFAVAT